MHLDQCGVKPSHRQCGGLNLGLGTALERDRAGVQVQGRALAVFLDSPRDL